MPIGSKRQPDLRRYNETDSPNDEVERRGIAPTIQAKLIYPRSSTPLLGPTKTWPRDRSNRLLDSHCAQEPSDCSPANVWIITRCSNVQFRYQGIRLKRVSQAGNIG